MPASDLWFTLILAFRRCELFSTTSWRPLRSIKKNTWTQKNPEARFLSLFNNISSTQDSQQTGRISEPGLYLEKTSVVSIFSAWWCRTVSLLKASIHDREGKTIIPDVTIATGINVRAMHSSSSEANMKVNRLPQHGCVHDSWNFYWRPCELWVSLLGYVPAPVISYQWLYLVS